MTKLSGAKQLAIIASMVVILSVIVAVFLLDPPSVQRQRRMDARRIEDLKSIEYSVDTYWERKKALPQSLSAMQREPGLKIDLKDPQTGNAYEYQLKTPKSYSLCAIFALDSSDDSQESSTTRKWSHGAGKQCFDLRPPEKAGKNAD